LEIYTVKFIYTLDADAEKPILLINTHIGAIQNAKGEVEEGVMGGEFMSELLELQRRGKRECEIWINSPGGVVSDGWAIYGTIVNLSSLKVTTLNIGIAASTAGWIFQAGHHRIMMDFAVTMMHNPHGGDGAGQKECTASIAIMLAARTNKSDEEILKLMKRTTFMGAEEALKLGFCDDVRPSVENKIKNLAELQETEYAGVAETVYEQGKVFLNTIMPTVTTKNKKMSQVTNLLNLNADASEASIAAEVQKLQRQVNEMEDAEKEHDKMCDEWDKEKKDMEKRHKEEMDALNARYDALNKKNKEAEETNAEMECKNLVAEYVKQGRIKNDPTTIAEMVNMVKIMTKEKAIVIFDGFPVNIAATQIPDAFKNVRFDGIAADEMETTDMQGWLAEIAKENKAKK
jgi:ATP-dependent protease ClpP protease subunit